MWMIGWRIKGNRSIGSKPQSLWQNWSLVPGIWSCWSHRHRISSSPHWERRRSPRVQTFQLLKTVWKSKTVYKTWVDQLSDVCSHRRTGNFLPRGRGVNHLPKKISQAAKFLRNSRKETRVILKHRRSYWHKKVAQYSFSGSIPSFSINYVAIDKHLEKLPPQ